MRKEFVRTKPVFPVITPEDLIGASIQWPISSRSRHSVQPSLYCSCERVCQEACWQPNTHPPSYHELFFHFSCKCHEKAVLARGTNQERGLLASWKTNQRTFFLLPVPPGHTTHTCLGLLSMRRCSAMIFSYCFAACDSKITFPTKGQRQ